VHLFDILPVISSEKVGDYVCCLESGNLAYSDRIR